MTHTNRFLTAITLGVVCYSANAEYVPDTREFPASSPLVFNEAAALSLSGSGAIEFWVDPEWEGNPGHHPVILANGQRSQPNYQLSISADQTALIVQSGDQFGRFDYDFSTGSSHHVALLGYEERMVAFINGKLIGAVAMSFQTGPAGDFYVGSAADGQAAFVGALSGVRIWDVPVEPENIAAYALRNVNDELAPHPNLAHLVALSDFRNDTFQIADSMVLPESDFMTQNELIEALGEAEMQAIDAQFTDENGDGNE